MPAAPVFDSFALLTFLRGEPGADLVASLLESAADHDAPVHMTEVNYAEVKYMVLRKNGPARWKDVAALLPTLPIRFHPVNRALADLAADFKSRHRLSLADACAAALAKQTKTMLVTGDPEFEALAKEIKIQWLPASA